MGLFNIIFGCGNAKTQTKKDYVDITSKTEEGFQDLIFNATEYKKIDSDNIEITIKGKHNETVVGFKIIVRNNIPPGIVNGQVDNSAFVKSGVKFISSGKESNDFIKVLSRLYNFPTDKDFTLDSVSFDVFSLNQNKADLEKGSYKFKLFFDPNNEQGLYSEIYLNTNLPSAEIGLPEKDVEYRELIIKALTK